MKAGAEHCGNQTIVGFLPPFPPAKSPPSPTAYLDWLQLRQDTLPCVLVPLVDSPQYRSPRVLSCVGTKPTCLPGDCSQEHLRSFKGAKERHGCCWPGIDCEGFPASCSGVSMWFPHGSHGLPFLPVTRRFVYKNGSRHQPWRGIAFNVEGESGRDWTWLVYFINNATRPQLGPASFHLLAPVKTRPFEAQNPQA